jgi:hypothetical protein
MAIQSNPSDVADAGIELWSGITNMNILAVNPTLAELNAMDINAKSEPNYTVEFSGQAYNKIVFWLGNDDAKVKAEILMAPELRTSKTGKNQWINKFGVNCWSEEAPTYEWFKEDGQHKAYIGEETLIKFMIAWANVLKGGEVTLDTMEQIVQGNVSELQAYVKALTNNQIKVLVGVKDGKYQTVYSKYFGKTSVNRTDFFVNELNKEFGSFNADFNADLEWGTHKPTASLVTPDSNDDGDWEFPDAPQNGAKKTEEVPF